MVEQDIVVGCDIRKKVQDVRDVVIEFAEEPQGCGDSNMCPPPLSVEPLCNFNQYYEGSNSESVVVGDSVIVLIISW
jgi:hypothetical protein